jgi:hypothetical protein
MVVSRSGLEIKVQARIPLFIEDAAAYAICLTGEEFFRRPILNSPFSILHFQSEGDCYLPE